MTDAPIQLQSATLRISDVRRAKVQAKGTVGLAASVWLANAQAATQQITLVVTVITRSVTLSPANVSAAIVTIYVVITSVWPADARNAH